jgi:hypothetical protein
MPTPDIFDAVLNEALSSLRQSDVDNLLGFEMDLEAALGDEEILVEANVSRTSDPRSRFEARAVISSSVGTVRQTEDVVWRVWRAVAYEEFAATSLARGPRELSLRFITAVPNAGLCVTGSLRVGGPHYQRLYDKDR